MFSITYVKIIPEIIKLYNTYIKHFIHTFIGANTALVSPNSSATVLPFETGRSPITTFAPCLTNLSTTPRPSPEAPPVTKATVP